MKTMLIFVLAGLMALQAHPAEKKDSAICLQVRGKILTSIKGNIKVELMAFNQVLQTIALDTKRKKFNFILKPFMYYTVRISGADCYTQLICFDTRHFDLTDYEPYEFSFITTLLPVAASPVQDPEIKDFPLAIVYFDKKTDKFDYNKSYTARIKKERAVKVARNN